MLSVYHVQTLLYKAPMYWLLYVFQQPGEAGSIFPTSQIKKWRLRAKKSLAHKRAASSGQNTDSDPRLCDTVAVPDGRGGSADEAGFRSPDLKASALLRAPQLPSTGSNAIG